MIKAKKQFSSSAYVHKAVHEYNLKPTKHVLGDIGQDSSRTITRTMAYYRLDPKAWPPSTWDAEHTPQPTS